MAGYFKKRKGPSGPNKNEEKVRRTQEKLRKERSTEPLSQRFPSVQKLTVQLEILGPERQLLSQEARAFGPSDNCRLGVACPGRCGVGSFDLETQVANVIAAGESQKQSSGRCQQSLYAGSAEVCGCVLQCRIEVVYRPQPPQETVSSEAGELP